MGSETCAPAPATPIHPTGVRQLLTAAVDASPLAITRAEVADTDGVVATLQRAGSATTKVVYSFEESPLELLLEGDESPEELQRFAQRVVGPVVLAGQPRTVLLDRGGLRDALLHLLDNATHHTAPGTRVECA